MLTTFFLLPLQTDVGLGVLTIGLYNALAAQGLKVAYVDLNPPAKQYYNHLENHLHIQLKRFSVDHHQDWQPMMLGHDNELIPKLLKHQAKLAKEYDCLLVRGCSLQDQAANSTVSVNQTIAKALSAQTIMVINAQIGPIQARQTLAYHAKQLRSQNQQRWLGLLVNQINAPNPAGMHTLLDDKAAKLKSHTESIKAWQNLPILKQLDIDWIGGIPWSSAMLAPTVTDICHRIQAKVICAGNMDHKRVYHVKLFASSINRVHLVLKPNTLILSGGDRTDLMIAATLAISQGIDLAGIIFTGSYQMPKAIEQWLHPTLMEHCPILTVSTNSFVTANSLKFNFPLPVEDHPRITKTIEHITDHLCLEPLSECIKAPKRINLSPPAFQQQIIQTAQSKLKRIVLPEGEDIRTIAAALHCSQKQIAQCTLLGEPDRIQAIASNQGLTWHPELIIQPPLEIADQYTQPLINLRKHKGLEEVMAKELLTDPITLGTMMLSEGHVDGLVSGATHTTANTIRPALQLIKTHPDQPLVSSVFFMCLPEQVLIFGDCAINPNPSAEQLATIAIQSAQTAKQFQITPKIAMLSYSTGHSGSGADVDKVELATQLIHQQRPDLEVDGPLQYDTALIETVAKRKAPKSPVAGQATVLIFPDLNTGNTTYKAVQRSAKIISMGPMLQGLKKPVNDLSRGASVQDIIYTIAITAIQAQQNKTS
jgi:phosphate acetyltransferase